MKKKNPTVDRIHKILAKSPKFRKFFTERTKILKKTRSLFTPRSRPLRPFYNASSRRQRYSKSRVNSFIKDFYEADDMS